MKQWVVLAICGLDICLFHALLNSADFSLTYKKDVVYHSRPNAEGLSVCLHSAPSSDRL